MTRFHVHSVVLDQVFCPWYQDLYFRYRYCDLNYSRDPRDRLSCSTSRCHGWWYSGWNRGCHLPCPHFSEWALCDWYHKFPVPFYIARGNNERQHYFLDGSPENFNTVDVVVGRSDDSVLTQTRPRVALTRLTLVLHNPWSQVLYRKSVVNLKSGLGQEHADAGGVNHSFRWHQALLSTSALWRCSWTEFAEVVVQGLEQRYVDRNV